MSIYSICSMTALLLRDASPGALPLSYGGLLTRDIFEIWLLFFMPWFRALTPIPLTKLPWGALSFGPSLGEDMKLSAMSFMSPKWLVGDLNLLFPCCCWTSILPSWREGTLLYGLKNWFLFSDDYRYWLTPLIPEEAFSYYGLPTNYDGNFFCIPTP